MPEDTEVLIKQGDREVSIDPVEVPGQDTTKEVTTEEKPAVVEEGEEAPAKDESPVFDPKAFEAITGKKITSDLEKEEEEAAKKDEKQEEEEKVKEEERQKAAEAAKEKLPPTARPPVTQTTEDFDATESQLFKRMANDAREYFQDKLRVLKRTQKEFEEAKKSRAELEDKLSKSGQLPASWYENENAYVLDPNYQQVEQAAGMAKWALDHYTEQLLKIKEGQDWEDLVQDPTTGAISRVTKRPDTASEVLVTQRINNANIHYQQQNQTMINLKATFGGRVKDAFSNIRKVEDNYFPQYADEKEVAKNEHIKTMMDVLKTRSLDRNILAGFLAKLYAFSMEQTEELTKLKAEAEKVKAVKTIVTKTEPPASKITGTAGSKGGETVDDLMAKYERVKAGLSY